MAYSILGGSVRPQKQPDGTVAAYQRQLMTQAGPTVASQEAWRRYQADYKRRRAENGGRPLGRARRTCVRGLGWPVLAVAVLLGVTGCKVGASGVINTPSIKVVTPVSEKLPFVQAALHMKVVDPPRGGTVRMDLNYYSKGAHRWEFAARDQVSVHGWKRGSVHVLIAEYVCLRSGLRWRMFVHWDGIAGDGTPSSGSRYWPNRTVGKKLTC